MHVKTTNGCCVCVSSLNMVRGPQSIVDVCALSGGFAFLSRTALLHIFAALLLFGGEPVVGDLLVRALDDPLEVSAEVLVDGAVFNVVGVTRSNASSVWVVDLLKLIQRPLRVPPIAVFR